MRLISHLKQKIGIMLIASLAPILVLADELPTFNMTKGVTRVSKDIYDLHMTIFLICCVIGVIVFGTLIYSIIHHRKSKGVVAADFHENEKLEWAWTILPFIILVVMAVPATRVLVDMKDTTKAALNIKVVGHQWKWQYEYLDQGINYFSNLATPWDQIHNKVKKGKTYLLDVDHPLVVPVHKKIRFLVTSNDVLHSWWVPAFGIKRDAIPGFIHEAWTIVDKPGLYYGRCAELCGADHGFMPVVVKAVSQLEFDKWVKAQQAKKLAESKASDVKMTKAELLKQGKADYLKHCAACHKPDGKGLPPMFPALKDGPIVVGPLAEHIHIVLHGKSGTAMQAFAAQLNDVQIASIITYERHAWGNDKLGTKYKKIVQPNEIKAARSK